MGDCCEETERTEQYGFHICRSCYPSDYYSPSCAPAGLDVHPELVDFLYYLVNYHVHKGILGVFDFPFNLVDYNDPAAGAEYLFNP